MDSRFKLDSDDLNELKNMPVCAEKLLISLMNDVSKVDDIHVFQDDFAELKERIVLEGLDSYEIDQLLKDIKTSLNRNEPRTAFSTLKSIHLKLRDLNIPKLLRITEENNEALDREIKDKNIYLFIGLTGSGKYIGKCFCHLMLC